MTKRRTVPAVLMCERCREMFALRLPICKCPEGPDISKWAEANGY